MTGTIKKLTDKGFGFIAAEGLQKDIFFHSKGLVGVQFSDLQEETKFLSRLKSLRKE